MFERRLNILLCVLGLVFALNTNAFAQHFSIGVWQGLKGVGISSHVPHNNGTFNSYVVGVDFEKVLFSKSNIPGFAASFAHLLPVLPLRSREARSLFLYYGPGVMTGIVRDGDKGVGFVACLSAVGGIRATFDKNIELALEWRANLGVHLTANRTESFMINSGLYRAGLARVYLPQLKIHYMF